MDAKGGVAVHDGDAHLNLGDLPVRVARHQALAEQLHAIVEGYREFLKALADPDDNSNDDMVRWWGDDFDTEDARIDRIVERFNRLAKKWAPRGRKLLVITQTDSHKQRLLS